MPETTIRRLADAELDDVAYSLGSYAFQPTPPLPDKADWADWTAGQKGLAYFAFFEDGRPASGAAGTPMVQNVRGKLFDAHGVWAVATGPAYRRRGYCREVLRAMMHALAGEGHVFSTLYPFKESFYERLGYVALALPRTARFPLAGLAPLLRRDLGGKVELTTLSEGYDAYRVYLLEMRKRTHGMGVFTYPNPVVQRHNEAWAALASIEGRIAGVMLYSMRGDPDYPFLMHASRFYYDSSQARYLLLQWIASHADQVDRVELQLAPAEQPETWLPDLHIRSETDDRGPMGRVLNVAALGGMAVGQGDFTARISDPLCPWNEGTWRFSSEHGRLALAPGGEAECELTIHGLTALVYGVNDPSDFAVRGWGDPDGERQSAMRSLFPPLFAHLHERF